MAKPRRTEYIPIAQLEDAPSNPKGHNIPGIIESIARFGFVEQAVIDERTGCLIVGHGRKEALLKMRADGAPMPDGLIDLGDDWAIPVTRGWSSADDGEAERLLVAANQLTIAGGWDDAKLAPIVDGGERRRADARRRAALRGRRQPQERIRPGGDDLAFRRAAETQRRAPRTDHPARSTATIDRSAFR